MIAALTAGAFLAALFFFWPYQHGHLDFRTSIANGILMLVRHEVEWIFCPAVPLIAGYLAWRRKRELLALPLKSSYTGAVLLLVGLLIYWAGYKADVRYLGFLSGQILLAALILWFCGWRWFKVLLFPWMFFVFTWPMPPLDAILSNPLKHISSTMGGVFLNLIGVETTRIGVTLHSAAEPALGLKEGAKFSLGVEDPCSGINSLFTLVMLSALYGYLSLKHPAHRFLLFCSSVPLALLGNFVRIVMLALGSMWWGSEFAVGITDPEGHEHPSGFHILAGLVVFAVALAGMFAISRLLELRERGLESPKPAKPSSESFSPAGIFVRGTVAALLAALTIYACIKTPVAKSLSPMGVVMSALPQAPGYQVNELEMSTVERQAFEEGVELSRWLYTRREDRSQFMTTIVMSGPVKRSLHQPEVCLPSQGWKIIESRVVDVPRPDGGSQKATLLELFQDSRDENGDIVRQRAYDLYYYVGMDVSTPSYLHHVYLTYRDGLLRNVNHRWGMVSIFRYLPPSVGSEVVFTDTVAEEEKLRQFAGTIVSQIQKF